MYYVVCGYFYLSTYLKVKAFLCGMIVVPISRFSDILLFPRQNYNYFFSGPRNIFFYSVCLREIISYLLTPPLARGTRWELSSGCWRAFDSLASPKSCWLIRILMINTQYLAYNMRYSAFTLLDFGHITLALTSSGASLLTSGFFSGAFIFQTTRGGVSCCTWTI